MIKASTHLKKQKEKRTKQGGLSWYLNEGRDFFGKKGRRKLKGVQ